MERIIILIPVHNRINITKRGIEKLNSTLLYYYSRQNDGKKFYFEIVVIDDGSTDGTTEWIKMNYPNIHLVKGDGSLWWSGSINKGLRYSTKNLDNIAGYLLWNDDLVPAVDYFIQLHIIISEASNPIAIGSMLLHLDQPKKIHGFGAIFNKVTGFKKYKYRGVHLDTINIKKTKSDWLPGMGTYLSKSIVENVGYLNDEKFPQYYGDMDYTLRVAKYGYKMYVYKNLQLYNDVKSTGITHPKNRKELMDAFQSNRSKYNIKQNFNFVIKHGYFPLSIIQLIRYYIAFFYRYFFKVNQN